MEWAATNACHMRASYIDIKAAFHILVMRY